MKLLEDRAKSFLRARGLPVPEGRVVASPAEAAAATVELGGRVAVKALVAAGRRGKAGGVRIAAGPEEAGRAADAILGVEFAGRKTELVYVEAAVDIAAEFYVSFGFGRLAPQIVVSRHGGVDIEATAAGDPAAIVAADIDPGRGLSPWAAAALWERAGIESRLVPGLGALSARLYEAFCAADALMLEVNPLVLAADGELSVVGAMLEADGNALFRHREWQDLGRDEAGPGGRPLNERELAVIEADRKFPGGAIRYTEVDGDIALFVSGGGAGLLQHDLVLAAGGRPANHSDLSPTPTLDKPAALFDAMFSNPNAKGLLVGFNYLQLAPCDLTIQGLLASIARYKVDARRFPIVIRLFGPREREARSLAAMVPGIHYMPHGASLAEGVAEIVRRVNALKAGPAA